MSTVAIDFACNDPRDGSFNARADMGSIDGNEIERNVGPVTFRETEKGFRIHRKEFEVSDRKEWVGNWCWNRYWMTAKEANRLARHLRVHGWRCACGDQQFYDFMNNP